MRIPIDDSSDLNETKTFYKYLDNSINLIKISIKDNLNVLVHCYAGIQRSATLVLCYIMNKISEFIDNNDNFIKKNNLNDKIDGLSLNNIIEFLKLKRDIVFYRQPTFIILINDYYNKHILNKLIN
jgi:protein tyrosine phosphatase